MLITECGRQVSLSLIAVPIMDTVTLCIQNSHKLPLFNEMYDEENIQYLLKYE